MERGLSLLEGEQKALIERAIASFRGKEREFFGLGSQMIHGNVNDHNVLVSPTHGGEHRVTGIIDLGDVHSAPRVFDLAIAIAYSILGTPDPFAAAAALTRGYHGALPLLEEELDVMMSLVRPDWVRACASRHGDAKRAGVTSTIWYPSSRRGTCCEGSTRCRERSPAAFSGTRAASTLVRGAHRSESGWRRRSSAQ